MGIFVFVDLNSIVRLHGSKENEEKRLRTALYIKLKGFAVRSM